MKTREVIKLLVIDGWVEKRSTGGSHVHFVPPTKKGKITVPIHGNRDLKPGTAASILRQAGISQKKT